MLYTSSKKSTTVVYCKRYVWIHYANYCICTTQLKTSRHALQYFVSRDTGWCSSITNLLAAIWSSVVCLKFLATESYVQETMEYCQFWIIAISCSDMDNFSILLFYAMHISNILQVQCEKDNAFRHFSPCNS